MSSIFLFLIVLRYVSAILPMDHGATKSCTEKEFTCDNGRCIPNHWQCDGEKDCDDGSDESAAHCKLRKCGEHQLECEPGTCIPKSWICDGMTDCLNNKDETNCSRVCEFTCTSGDCIAEILLCDGIYDCKDGSDEDNCTKACNKSKDFQCTDLSCIPVTWKCDGEYDCTDGSDEKDCSIKPTLFPGCHENEFQCMDHKTCIDTSKICDGYVDCMLHGDDESPDMCPCRVNQFKCKNQSCIEELLHCDGKSDCPDGSDEENCSSPKLCNENEFDCGQHICIANNKVCNGHQDCPNGEDEPSGKCNLNECLINNGDCEQICVDTGTSYYCSCRNGFKLTTNYSCEDINECENPGACSHSCINEEGTFKCECQIGYQKDPYDRTRCKPTEGRTHLLFARTHDIRLMSIDHKDMTVVVDDTKSATAIDFIYKNGLIFWSDENKIYKAPIDQGNIRSVVINNIKSCEGLAVDWLYNHVYWTDTGMNAIEVATFDGRMRKTLISTELDEPRAIALNPLEGWLYWSDWGQEGKIERAGLDGSSRETIVSRDIKWPNGLALDLVRKRLYWADAKLNTISSVNYDGSGRVVILKESEILHHPFSISVFEDVIYWTDWEKETIFKANKFNGSNVISLTALRKLKFPMVLHVYHSYRQPNGTNYCLLNNANCSHFCLPAPQINVNSQRTTCACPEDLMLKGQNCVLKVEFTTATHLEASKKSLQIEPVYAETNNGPVIVVVGMSIILFIAFSSLVAFFVYRNFLNQGASSVNFDNPVYRKTTEDNLVIVKSHTPSELATRLTNDLQKSSSNEK